MNEKIDIVEEAKWFAINAHRDTNHTYDDKPYEVHLQMVYDAALRNSGLIDPRFHSIALAAAWTHDVIEDCRQTYNDVKCILGKEVKTRKERANDKYYDGIRRTPLANFIKICDRLANVAYSKENNMRMFEMYEKEHAFFKEQLMTARYIPMFIELEELFEITNKNN